MDKKNNITVGYGTYKLKEKHLEITLPEIYKLGYRIIDTATLYGNQKAIYKVLGKHELSTDMFNITSKVDRFNIGNRQKVLNDVESTFRDLNVKQLDTLLLHAPTTPENDLEAWHILEDLYTNGMVKNIGVSNYDVNHLTYLLEKCNVKPVVNQIEITPFLARERLTEFCNNNDIKITAHSSLTKTRKFENTTIQELSKKYDTTPASILLSWAKYKHFNVIPRTTNLQHLQDNIINFVQLEHDDISLLDKCDEGFATHPQYIAQ
jgi:diketogulonate reductase-like aldo/keto reductase